jgi:hypothetical protein
MGHERASTTLDLYTHTSQGWDSSVRRSFADFPLTFGADDAQEEDDDDS